MSQVVTEAPIVHASDDRLLLNGEPINLWGIRTGSATATAEQTQHLIDQLDIYKAHGINAVTVFYMGCSGANYDPFSPDGSRIDPEHASRMKRVVEACAKRDMIVIAGIFYQHAPFGLTDAKAVKTAVRTVTDQLRPYGNVIINIANEHNSYGYEDVREIFDFHDPARIIDLCEVVTDEDTTRLVGGGGYDVAANIEIGQADDVDVLLFDTGMGDESLRNSGLLHDRFRDAGVHEKPLINVETFGGWTSNFSRGEFDEPVKRAYYDEVDRTAVRPGLSLFFHNGPWCQSTESPMRYDLGGTGTAEDPGIRWYFEYVRDTELRLKFAEP